MGVTIAGSKAHPAHFQRRYAERGIDITGAAALDLAGSGCLEQAVEPEVVIEPDTYNETRTLQPQHILRLRLILLGVEIGRHEANRFDQVAAHRLGQAAQIGGRGDDLNTVLCPHR